MKHKKSDSESTTFKNNIPSNNSGQKQITKICLIVGFIIIGIGIAFFFGLDIDKKVHRTTEFFEWEGKSGFVIIKFTSEGNTFTTGQTITVKPTLAFELTGTDDDPKFFLNLPKALYPTEYEDLIRLDDELTTEVTEHSFEYKIPVGWSYHRVWPSILAKDFEAVWTQEGFQNGKLAIIHSDPNRTKEIDLPNIINLHSSEILLQLTASEKANGLVIIIVGLSVITAVPGFLKLKEREH